MCFVRLLSVRKIWTTVCLFVALSVVYVDPLWGQTHLRNRTFINTGAPESYLNYGRKEYDPYPSVINARNRYDRLGNFLARGYNVFKWEFSRPGFSEINTRTAQYLGWFNNLVMLSDSYRGFNYRVTLGEDIRTKLTDLTMKDPRFFGVLLDGASSDNKFTLMLSQGGDMLTTPKFSSFQAGKESSPVLIVGGHWESKLGNLLRLGATYYNQHMVNASSASGSFTKGDMPSNMLQPSLISVVVNDDSPEDIGTSAIVYRVDIVVEGVSRGQPIRYTSIAGDADYNSNLEPVISGLFVDNGDQGKVASGPAEQVIFEFTMPEYVLPASDADFAAAPSNQLEGITITSVRFQADIAGDYRVGTRQRYAHFSNKVHEKNLSKVAAGDEKYLPGNSKYVNPYTGLKGDDALLAPMEAHRAGHDVFNHWPVRPDPGVGLVNPFMQYRWDEENPENVSYTVVRSSGKGTGNGNRETITFSHGIPTGQTLYGMDWDLEMEGFKLNGEFVLNPQHFMFPVGSNSGRYHSKTALGYFVTLEKKLGPLSLGGELFNMDPDYSGNYDSRRGGIPFFTDQCGTCPQMQEMFVMNDNDDNDQWPDEYINERPSAEKVDSGIFPGNDENQDLVPDTDQNFNGIPDWTEPILFYDADPPDFIYGIDFNNNEVVDYRENDDEPDYPYRKDRQGMHVLLMLDRLGKFGEWLTVGSYQMSEEAGGGEANTLYARYQYKLNSPILGQIRINNDLKFVEDNIRDHVYIWQDVGLSERIDSPFPSLTGPQIEARDLNTQLLPPTWSGRDELTMRNSMVNTLFFESRIKQLTGFNFINNIKWVRNSQRAEEFADGVMQEADLRSFLTMVNKVDYTLSAGNLEVRPMFKHLLLRNHSSLQKDKTGAGSIESFSIVAPIVRTRFDLTPKSNIQFGFQGLPFLRYRNIDRVNDANSFNEWTMVLMMSNRSDHYGYNLASQFGIIKEDREFTDETRQADSYSNSRLFFDIVAGF